MNNTSEHDTIYALNAYVPAENVDLDTMRKNVACLVISTYTDDAGTDNEMNVCIVMLGDGTRHHVPEGLVTLVPR